MKNTATRRGIMLLTAASLLGGAAFAQTTFPDRPIRILVGFGAGGGTDTVARVYAQKMTEVLNSPVIVENRPGASQLLAIRPMMAAPADGYTLFLGTGSSLAQGPGVRNDLPYDPVKSFTHIGSVAIAPGVFFVHPSLPVHSIRELISYAKANPGKLNYGSAGFGSANHLQSEFFKNATGVSMEHIAYKSDQDVTREVAGGSVQVGLTIAQFAIPLVQSGKLRAIGVTGSTRVAALPNVPAITETGIAELKGVDNYTFYGLVGPAGMPPAVVAKLNDAINKVSAMPDVVSRMRDSLYFEPASGTPDGLRKYLEAEAVKWRALGKAVKIDVGN